MKLRILLIVLLLSLVSSVRAQDSRTLIVFAAASLTDAFEEVGAAFEAENPGVDVLFNFAGSSDLAAQLVEGVPADVFASANARQMNVAIDAGVIAADFAAEPPIFVRNRLVVIVPADNPARIETLNDLANTGIKLVIAAEGVPVRDYTETMLDALAADADYDAAYRNAVLANVVSEEANVRQVAAKVALGEADAGIVYASDVTPDIADDVIAIAVPDAYNVIAAYPIAAVSDGAEPALARDFIDFVLSDVGQTLLADWNFVPVIELPSPEATPEATTAP
ncbi:MAG: molybdate ABC transporter substrate-binding protein [Chloroflexota bacterium]|nr:molybdate ABC transporter substrate-binding protein [Chloroflexota bacterium]